MDKKKMAACLVVLLVCLGVGWIMYERNSGGTDSGNGNNVGNTIQCTQNEIRDVGNQINAATTEFDNGRDAVNRAENAVGKLEDSRSERAELIGECEQLISEIRNIFTDIDAANRSPTG